VPSLADKVSGLFSPFTLFDGVRMWLGGTDPADGVSSPGGFGVVYALVLVAILALCLYGLAARYRKERLS
jgi:ABC-2 type transport system permease protein